MHISISYLEKLGACTRGIANCGILFSSENNPDGRTEVTYDNVRAYLAYAGMHHGTADLDWLAAILMGPGSQANWLYRRDRITTAYYLAVTHGDDEGNEDSFEQQDNAALEEFYSKIAALWIEQLLSAESVAYREYLNVYGPIQFIQPED